MGELLGKLTEASSHIARYSKEPLREAIDRQRDRVMTADRYYSALLPESTPMHTMAMLSLGDPLIDQLIRDKSEIYQRREVTFFDRWILHLLNRTLIVGVDISRPSVFGIPGWFAP